MTKRKKIVLIVCSLLVGIPLLTVGGIFLYLSAEQAARQRDEANRTAAAEKAAVAWVEEKYGFTPEFVDTLLERDGALFDSYYTGAATVWLSDGSDLFRVHVGGDDARNGDNYQQQEITDALLAEVNRILPGGETIRAWFSNIGETDSCFHEKFTGGNLRQLLAEHENMRLVVGYVNTDFAGAPDFPLLRECGVYTELYSFDSEEHRADAIKTELFFDGEDWAPMLTGGLYVRADGNEAFTYDVIDCGDFKVMYSYEQEGAPPKVTPEDGDAVIRRFREQYPNTDLAAGTAHGWKVVTGGQAFYLYYPVHGEIPSMHCIDAVVETETADESTYFQHSNMYAHGDYYVLECSNTPIHRIAVIE